MKLLGWMRHKLKQGNKEPFKDFTTATSFLEDQETFQPCMGSNQSPRALEYPHQLRPAPFSCFNPDALSESKFEETPFANGDIFNGFLTIGTLGTEQFFSEPETPTFNESFENITEQKTEMTQKDLKIIKNELEKFVEAETEGYSDQSGRNSYVSIVTICEDKPITDSSENEENEKMVEFPLQGYLFGSSIEFLETRTERKKEKTSLRDLFQKTPTIDENCKDEHGKLESQTNPANKSAKSIVKKILKKLHTSPRSTTPSSKNDSVSAKKKLQKVVKMFHRKIHPENSENEREANNHSSKLMKKNVLTSESCISGHLIRPDCEESNLSYHPRSNPNVLQLIDPDSRGKRGQWITTDAEYLVLEL